MSKLSNEDLDALLALARAATPGPWFTNYTNGECCVTSPAGVVNNVGGAGKRTDIGSFANINGLPGKANAEFAVAANPRAITALVQQLQEAQRDAERLRIAHKCLTSGGLTFDDWMTALDELGALFAAKENKAIAAISKERQP